jgi:hypothetical protein
MTERMDREKKAKRQGKRREGFTNSNEMDDSDLPYYVRVGGNKARQFIDKQTGDRLRGEDADVAALMFSRVNAIASKHEFDALQESVLRVVLEKTKSEYESTMGKNVPEVQHWPFIVDTKQEHYTCSMLCNDHSPWQTLTFHEPKLVRIFNTYILFNSSHCIYHSPFLERILYAYCVFVEYQIIKELNMMACMSKTGSSEAIDELIQKARRTIVRVPPVLRICFNLQRHATACFQDPEHYHFPIPLSNEINHWNVDYVKTSRIWHKLVQGSEYANTGRNDNNTSVNDMEMVYW